MNQYGKTMGKTSRCNTYTNIYHTAQQFMEKTTLLLVYIWKLFYKKKEKKKQNTHIRRDKNTPNSTNINKYEAYIYYINTIVYI